MPYNCCQMASSDHRAPLLSSPESFLSFFSHPVHKSFPIIKVLLSLFSPHPCFLSSSPSHYLIGYERNGNWFLNNFRISWAPTLPSSSLTCTVSSNSKTGPLSFHTQAHEGSSHKAWWGLTGCDKSEWATQASALIRDQVSSAASGRSGTGKLHSVPPPEELLELCMTKHWTQKWQMERVWWTGVECPTLCCLLCPSHTITWTVACCQDLTVSSHVRT